jgi:hypothetical protein
MSAAAFANSKGHRRLCQSCQDRKARFAYRGRVKADRDHTLCFECYRAERERRRACALAEIPRPLPVPFAGSRGALTGAQVEHRRRMLAHLAGGV